MSTKEVMKKLTVVLSLDLKVTFIGKYRRDLEKPNWHYYEDKTGNIQHFRKDQMIAVLEGDNIVCTSMSK